MDSERPPDSVFTDDDIRRIAIAVCDEMERRRGHRASVRFIPAHELGGGESPGGPSVILSTVYKHGAWGRS